MSSKDDTSNQAGPSGSQNPGTNESRKQEEEDLLASDHEMETDVSTPLTQILNVAYDTFPGYMARIIPLGDDKTYAVSYNDKGERIIVYAPNDLSEEFLPSGKRLDELIREAESYPAQLDVFEEDFSAGYPVYPSQKDASTQVGRSYAEVTASKPVTGKGVDAGKGKLPLRPKTTQAQGLPDPKKVVLKTKKGPDPTQPSTSTSTSTSKAAMEAPMSIGEQANRDLILKMASQLENLQKMVTVMENRTSGSMKRDRTASVTSQPEKTEKAKKKKRRKLRSAQSSLERDQPRKNKEEPQRKGREPRKAEKAKPAPAPESKPIAKPENLPRVPPKDRSFLFAESMHSTMSLRDRCAICGEKSHRKAQCPNVGKVSCVYFYCKDIDHTAHEHDVSVCPKIVRICEVCRVRGHEPGPACGNGRKGLRQLFEGRADNHVYAQFRREIFSWGYVYIGSEKAAKNLAKKFSYEEFIFLEPDQIEEEIALASK